MKKPLKMRTKTILSLLALFAGIFLSASASALSWQDAILVNNLLNRGDYDVVWEGPYKGGNLLVTFNGNKGSGISATDLSNNDFVAYNRNDITSYSSSNRYGGYSSRYSNSYNQ